MQSETSDPIPPQQTPFSAAKTALVLSSGGLLGAYQAGVWKYLHESGFRPDLIVGASVGALNGWAIAGGCNPGPLIDYWLDETWANVLRRRGKVGLRAGYFDPEPLRIMTARLFEAYRPSPSFGLVTVELPLLRTRLITGHLVTADHLLATASIPLVMPAVSINGKSFIDGGLLEDVPIWAALKMGATRIVAVDAMHFDCPWWFRAGVSPTRWFAPRIKSEVREQTTLIRPPRPLGDYREALTWDRARIQDWIHRGYADAQAAFARQQDMPSLCVPA